MQQFKLNTFNKLNQPLQQIAELNNETFPKFSYLKPEDFQMNNPQVLVEKSVQIFIENSHRSLDYMHQLFNIWEHSWENISQEAREKTQDMMKQSQSYASSMGKELSRSAPSRASTKSTSNSKNKTSSSYSNLTKNGQSRNTPQHTASSGKREGMSQKKK
ncbi:hypothetical protein [Legionella sp. WA2024007413]